MSLSVTPLFYITDAFSPAPAAQSATARVIILALQQCVFVRMLSHAGTLARPQGVLLAAWTTAMCCWSSWQREDHEVTEQMVGRAGGVSHAAAAQPDVMVKLREGVENGISNVKKNLQLLMNRGSRAGNQATKDAKKAAGMPTNEAERMAQKAQGSFNEAKKKAGMAPPSASDRVKDAANQAAASAQEAAQQAAGASRQAANQAGDASRHAANQAGDAAQQAYDSAGQAAQNVKKEAGQAAQNVKNEL